MSGLRGLFRRRHRAADPVQSPVAQGISEAPAWRRLAPIEPAVTRALGTPAAARTVGFVRELPTRWRQPPALSPLSHDLRADAASGVLGGLITPVAGAVTSAATAGAPGTPLRWPVRTAQPSLTEQAPELPQAGPARQPPAPVRAADAVGPRWIASGDPPAGPSATPGGRLAAASVAAHTVRAEDAGRAAAPPRAVGGGGPVRQVGPVAPVGPERFADRSVVAGAGGNSTGGRTGGTGALDADVAQPDVTYAHPADADAAHRVDAEPGPATAADTEQLPPQPTHLQPTRRAATVIPQPAGTRLGRAPDASATTGASAASSGDRLQVAARGRPVAPRRRSRVGAPRQAAHPPVLAPGTQPDRGPAPEQQPAALIAEARAAAAPTAIPPSPPAPSKPAPSMPAPAAMLAPAAIPARTERGERVAQAPLVHRRPITARPPALRRPAAGVAAAAPQSAIATDAARTAQPSSPAALRRVAPPQWAAAGPTRWLAADRAAMASRPSAEPATLRRGTPPQRGIDAVPRASRPPRALALSALRAPGRPAASPAARARPAIGPGPAAAPAAPSDPALPTAGGRGTALTAATQSAGTAAMQLAGTAATQSAGTAAMQLAGIAASPGGAAAVGAAALGAALDTPGQRPAPTVKALTSPSAVAADQDPAALDRLAGQLYGRLRSHLASDLLVGRERAHLLTDL